jgi:hypothetical protein
VDRDDLITRALEPGEKVVWSDRPHGLLSATRRAFPGPGCAVFAVVGVGFALGALSFLGKSLVTAASQPASSLLGNFLIHSSLGALALAAFPVATGIVVLFRRVLPHLNDFYAATDRGRALVSSAGVVTAFNLPAEELTITTTARGDQETGTIEIAIGTDPEGLDLLRHVVFTDVSYPLIAVETLRAAAAARRSAP